MIKDWNELPIGTYIKIYDLTDDSDRVLRIAAILGGMTYDEILNAPLSVSRALIKNTEFLAKKPKLRRAKGEYVLNGKKFIFTRELGAVSTAQYIDAVNLPKDLYHIPEMAAIFLIPEGHTYNDGYNMDEVVKTINDYLSFEDYNAISGFFLGSYLISMRRFERMTSRAIKRAIKEKTATKEDLKKFRRNLKVVQAATIGSF